ncbi:MAG TPA: type II toxin-antitoxin system HicB family antitoxin [Steroidobacteraceae bacterium]
MKYAVVIENAAANFSAHVPDLPGCVATSTSVEETEKNIREAIGFHLDGMGEDGAPIPPASSRVDILVSSSGFATPRSQGWTRSSTPQFAYSWPRVSACRHCDWLGACSMPWQNEACFSGSQKSTRERRNDI